MASTVAQPVPFGMFASTPPEYQKNVDHSPPASPTEKRTKTPDSFDSVPVVPVRIESVAKAVVCAMDIPEPIVQMAIDYQRLEKGIDFANAAQLFTAADDLFQNPEKQAIIAMKLGEAEQFVKEEKTKNRDTATNKGQDSEVYVSDKVKGECISGDSFASYSEEMCKEVVHDCKPLVGDNAQLQEKVKKLAMENHRLKQRKTCRACRKVDLASSGVTFLPCGHFITCEGCSDNYDNCPACGKSILGTVRTFLS